MELLEKLTSSDLSSSEVINLLHDEHLSAWDNHIESLIKLKDDKLLLKTVIFLGTKVACDNHHESDEEEIRRVYEKQVKILTRTCRKEFLELLTTRVSAWSLPKSKKVELSQDELGNALLSINSFCEAVLDKLPYLGKDLLPNLICTGIGVLAASPQLSSQHPALLKEFLGLQQKTKEINETFEIEKEVVRKGGFSEEYERILHSKEPPQDFRKIEIVPTLKELLEDKRPFLRPNKIKGSYFSPEHYLDVQFRLLREDFVQPLRKGVEHFLENKEEYLKTKGKKKFKNQQQDASVRIYTGVTFNHVEKSRESGKVHFFNLPQEMVRKVNWTKSKKLLPGCLVMLTSDCCETAIFATTLAPPFEQSKSTKNNKGVDSRRQELSEGILRVSIETGVEQVEKHLSYVMLECEAYFEAYRYNLGILQKTKIVKDDSLINKFIVEASSSIKVPSYANRHVGRNQAAAGDPIKLMLPFGLPVYGPLTQEMTRFQLSFTKESVSVPVSQTEEWPDSLIKSEMGLDDNQYQAYKTALTSELSIIQGPPGTGKTFIGLQIVKTLLLNKNRRRNAFTLRCNRNAVVPNSPILVLCYTNHALDQFLELLLREISDLDLVRVGGQCKSDILKGKSLQEKRFQSRSFETNLFSEVQSLERQFSKLLVEVGELENPRGIFNFKRLTSGAILLQKLPLGLRKVLESGDWLGVPKQIFEPVDPELKGMLIKGMALNPAETKGVVQGAIRELQQVYDEDYDMDELLEHRLEDAYYDNILKQDGSQTNETSYHSNCSFVGCREKVKFLDWQISNYAKADIQHKKLPPLDVLEFEKEACVHRAKLLTAIFDLHRHGQLQLPNPDNLLRLERIFQPLKVDDFLNEDEFFGYDKEESDDDDEKKKVVEKIVMSQPYKDLESYTMSERWAIYFKVVEMARDLGREKLEQMERGLHVLRLKLKEERQNIDGQLLKQTDVIGMTTTGAAKNHLLLEIARPQIVVIEEAAEILEAHIVTSLTEDCNQLILIGDHLQLRPSTNVYQLEKKYHMNVSLFERMILNKINLCTLKTQHRMCPEVADLIVGPIYEQLHNHPKVLEYPHVKGVVKNLYFLTHSQLENTDTELLSKSNYFEANFISGLCEYLLNQGYSKDRITILTTYTGQMFLLKKVISPSCIGVRITCVDNYQGEENDIILLSLVRSNEDDKIGFVGIDNRICVSLSRAKHGMYIVGNLEGLMKTSKTWKKIGAKLEAGGNCGESLELICAQHGNKTKVSERAHFAPLKLGGCGLKCNMVLECAHRCPLYCHAQDHEAYDCNQRCEKRCQFDHQCHARCWQECPPCGTLVLKELPCAHELNIGCAQEPSTYPCPVIVTKALKCLHTKDLACHVNVSTIKCQTQVEKTLRCGHIRTVQCYELTHLAKCDVEIDHTFDNCKHTGRIFCYQRGKVRCRDNCEKTLDCGHECPRTCHIYDDPTHKKYICRLECKRVCILGHPCQFKHRCYGRCPPCPALTPKMLDCGHEAKLPCHKLPSTHTCTEKIPKLLTCGHEQFIRCGVKPENFKCKAKCEKLCGLGHSCGLEHACYEKCPPCQSQVVKSLPCNPNHKASLACHDDGANYKCTQPTEKELECGHKVNEECHLDTKDIICNELILQKYLDCGHQRYVLCFLQCVMVCQNEACRRESGLQKQIKTDEKVLEIVGIRR